MTIPFGPTALTPNYQEFGGGSLYSTGYLLLQGGSADVILEYAPASGTGNFGEVAAPNVGAGQYLLSLGGRNLLRGIKARTPGGAAATGQQVQGQLFEPHLPSILPVAAGISAAATLINGITGRASTTGVAQQGTGFTVVHNAVGDCNLNWSTPFSSPPIVIATALGSNSTLGTSDTVMNVGAPGGAGTTTCRVLSFDSAGNPTDTTFYFIAIVAQ